MSNSLKKESNLYLQQHAEGPLAWQVYSPEVLRRAVKENKILFISIGYATCHWCHVMKREAFSDEQIADFLNQHFISIKIDREERPDVDDYYIKAAHLLGSQAGWPLNVFALPCGKPFFTGTYFPLFSQQSSKMPSFQDVLTRVVKLWHQNQDEVVAYAQRVHRAIGDAAVPQEIFSQKAFFRDVSENDYHQLFGEDKVFFDEHERYFDEKKGGFLLQPRVKFPCFLNLSHLLKISFREHNERGERAWQMVKITLKALQMGGIYDQIHGGLCRYSVDYQWNIPHFEKMLYDQALYLEVLTNFFRMSFAKNQQVDDFFMYVEAANGIERFLQENLFSPEYGLYFCALDAESDGREGAYYLWTKKEIEDLLGDESSFFFSFFQLVFDRSLGEGGVLRIAVEQFESAQQEKKRLGESLKKLAVIQKKRKKPQVDDKLLLEWNALTIAALCQWFSFSPIFISSPKKHQKNIDTIKKMIEAIENIFLYKKTWFRRFARGERKHLAQLSDLSAYSWALITAYTLTWDNCFLERAGAVAQQIVEIFYDEKKKVFCQTQALPLSFDQPAEIAQTSEVMRYSDVLDSVKPSGQAMTARVFLYLSHYFSSPNYLDFARSIFLRYKKELSQISFASLLSVLHQDKCGFWFLKIVGDDEQKMKSQRDKVQKILEKTGFFLYPHALFFEVNKKIKLRFIVCNENRCFPFAKNTEALELLLRQHFSQHSS